MFVDCISADIRWFREDLNSWRDFKRKVNLIFQMFSFKEKNAMHSCIIKNHLPAGLVDKFCLFSCSTYRPDIATVTHGRWGTFYNIKQIISHASKVMLKILQARLQQYVNWELPDVQVRFRRSEEPELKLPISVGSWKKQGNSRKTSTSSLCQSLCVDHNKLENS